MVHKYRMEAKAARKLHTCPLPIECSQNHDNDAQDATDMHDNSPVTKDQQQELQVEYEARTARQLSSRPTEDGITELDIPQALEPDATSKASKEYFSPLTTVSR